VRILEDRNRVSTTQFLEEQLAELRKRDTENHPDVQDLKKKLDAAKFAEGAAAQIRTGYDQIELQQAMARIDSAKKMLVLQEQALADEQKKLAIGATSPESVRQRQIDLENARYALEADEESILRLKQQADLGRVQQDLARAIAVRDAERQRQTEFEKLEQVRQITNATNQRDFAEQSAKIAEMQRTLLATEAQLKAQEAQMNAQMAELRALMEALKAQKEQQK
jgi:hypothetical protein